MAQTKLRFSVKLEGKEGSSVAWMNAPFEGAEDVWHECAGSGERDDQWIPVSLVAHAHGGCHGMAVNKAMREGAKAKAGDVVEVVMERDVEARTVEAPPELKTVLAKHKKAQEYWDKLAFTHKNRDGHLDSRGQTGRNEGAALGESCRRPQKGDEVDGVTVRGGFRDLKPRIVS